ncbi:MAG: hypothetical protein WKF97_12095 [Chitinophagaceae bacterium]
MRSKINPDANIGPLHITQFRRFYQFQFNNGTPWGAKISFNEKVTGRIYEPRRGDITTAWCHPFGVKMG